MVHLCKSILISISILSWYESAKTKYLITVLKVENLFSASAFFLDLVTFKTAKWTQHTT